LETNNPSLYRSQGGSPLLDHDLIPQTICAVWRSSAAPKKAAASDKTAFAPGELPVLLAV